jgi:hypothetical protein
VPVLKQRIVFQIARNIRAFMNLEAGLTRGKIPELGLGASDSPAGEEGRIQNLARVRRRAKRQEEQIASLKKKLEQVHRQLAAKDRELVGSKTGVAGGIDPGMIVWIFGAGRTGSTWLSSMMAEVEGYTLWGEPWVGTLFGNFYYITGEGKHRNPQFILGRHKESWLGSIRNFVLDAAAATFPKLGNDHLIIKEPNGSTGAPLLMEALPESRMILLVRDPRDIVASSMDARREGSWNYERNRELTGQQSPLLGKNPDAFAEGRAKGCMRQIGKAKEAYDAHEGRKTLVRYEDLRTDTLGVMKRLYSELGLVVDERELTRTVEKHSWENIPTEKKGEGKFYRKATPGGWREDLTPEQARVVGEITAPLLNTFYPDET